MKNLASLKRAAQLGSRGHRPEGGPAPRRARSATGYAGEASPRILFVTAGGWTLASARCRVLQYLPRLGDEWQVDQCALGVSVWSRRLAELPHHSAHMPWQRALRRLRWQCYRVGARRADAALWSQVARAAGEYDLIFLQKAVPPLTVMRHLADCGARLVYDFDDTLFDDSGGPISRAEARYRERVAACLACCDRVVTCSAANRECAEQFGAQVEILATPVDTERYHPRPRISENGNVTIGWVGSPSTTPFLRSALPVLGEVATARPGARFVFLGAEPFPLEGLPAVVPRWTYETELEYLAAFDVGIMPLRPSRRADGKAGYKLLQYMALGLSSVASPDGVNATLVQDGVTGFLASDAAAWRHRLITLIDDAPLRERMGLAAREAVVRAHSVDVLFPRWQAILAEVLEEGRGGYPGYPAKRAPTPPRGVPGPAERGGGPRRRSGWWSWRSGGGGLASRVSRRPSPLPGGGN